MAAAAATISQVIAKIPPAYAHMLMASFCITRICQLDARDHGYSAVAFNLFIGFCFFGTICCSSAYQWLLSHRHEKTPNKYAIWLLYTATLFACAHHFAPFFGPIVAKFLYVFATMGSSLFLLHLYLIKDNHAINSSSDCCTKLKRTADGNLKNCHTEDLDSNTKEEEEEEGVWIHARKLAWLAEAN